MNLCLSQIGDGGFGKFLEKRRGMVVCNVFLKVAPDGSVRIVLIWRREKAMSEVCKMVVQNGGVWTVLRWWLTMAARDGC